MEDKKHSFMDQLNLFFIGAVIGVIYLELQKNMCA